MKDYEELVKEYGLEYLADNCPDDYPIDMDEFNNYFNDPLRAVESAFCGGRYGWENDSFNPNDEYFHFDGYGNPESFPDYVLDDYVNDHIGETDFLAWGEEHYPEDFEDDEDEEDE